MKHRGEHAHEYRVHGIGAGLQRAICTQCGEISIRTISNAERRELPVSPKLIEVAQMVIAAVA